MTGVPVELVFNPNWWFRNYGIAFDRSFYFDRRFRIEHDLCMRRALYERYGLGKPHPRPRPIVGSRHVAGGFVVPALLGVEYRFSRNQAPCAIPRERSREEILALRVPDIFTTWPMDRLIADMDALESEYGHVVGDFDADGILVTALHLRGNRFFIDMLEDEELTRHLFSVVTETTVLVARYVKSRTGTSSISVNRSIVNLDPGIYLHGNCSVQMISPRLYRNAVLPFERRLADALRPYGIHHCGDNMHLFAEAYSELAPVFCDVGWGSDVALCRQRLPGVFLNLRLSPVRMLQESAETIRRDTEQLLRAAGPGNVGVCCINMDYGTPDENVLAMIETARRFAAAASST
jgi:uroporphyrinogen-III decarboxylase